MFDWSYSEEYFIILYIHNSAGGIISTAGGLAWSIDSDEENNIIGQIKHFLKKIVFLCLKLKVSVIVKKRLHTNKTLLDLCQDQLMQTIRIKHKFKRIHKTVKFFNLVKQMIRRRI